jgi:putative ABC transport system ATP-binding protein
LTALENVMLPLELAGSKEAASLAREALVRVGLSERLSHYPKHLSGGEQQRVALAASLVHHPGLLVVDEPTSQLDGGSRDAALDLLDDVRRESGATMVIATHDPLVADRADRRLRMALGRLLPAGAA